MCCCRGAQHSDRPSHTHTAENRNASRCANARFVLVHCTNGIGRGIFKIKCVHRENIYANDTRFQEIFPTGSYNISYIYSLFRNRRVFISQTLFSFVSSKTKELPVLRNWTEATTIFYGSFGERKFDFFQTRNYPWQSNECLFWNGRIIYLCTGQNIGYSHPFQIV